MACHGGPNIIEDNLLVYLDAANTKSYPGTGATWTDISSNGNNGTLTNGPTFSSDNGGSIVFDGSDDCVELGSDMFDPNSNFTFVAWVNPDTLSGSDTLISRSGDTSSFQLRINSTAGSGSTPAWQIVDSWQVDVGVFSDYTPTANTWSNVTVTRSSNTYTLYINGSNISNFTNSEAYTYGARTIGVNNNNLEEWDGKVSIVMAYDKVLSAAEIKQNFNAHKGRYGL